MDTTQGTATNGRRNLPVWGSVPPLWVLGGCLFILGWIVDHWLLGAGAWGRIVFTDTPVYLDFVSKVFAGGVPYRDFPVGYPPLAWLAFLGPAVFPAAVRDPVIYASVFGVSMAVLGTILAILAIGTSEALGHSRRRTVLVAVAVAATPALLGMIAPTHFDLWPATLLCASLLLHLVGHRRTSAVVLGLAAAAKVYPAVLAPLLAFEVLRRDGRRSLAVWSVAFVGGAAAPYIPFALSAPLQVFEPLFNQAVRPLQVESLGAAILLAAHWTAGLPVAVAMSFGSYNLVGDVAELVRQDLHALTVLGLFATWTWYAWVGGGTERLARAAALALAITVAADSTLSPQYMLWLVPAVFLVPGRRGLAAMAAAILAFLLTSAYFPTGYDDLVKLRSATPAWILLARDLGLVALVAVLAVPGAGSLLRCLRRRGEMFRGA
jgi:hypothetical protein